MPDFDVDQWLNDNGYGGDFGADLSTDIFDWTEFDVSPDQFGNEVISEIWTPEYWAQSTFNDSMDPIVQYMIEWASSDTPPQYWASGTSNGSNLEGEDLVPYPQDNWPPSGEDFAMELFMQMFINASHSDQVDFAGSGVDQPIGTWNQWANEMEMPGITIWTNWGTGEGQGGPGENCEEAYYDNDMGGGVANEPWTACWQSGSLYLAAQQWGEMYGVVFNEYQSNFLAEDSITTMLGDLIASVGGDAGLIAEFNANYGQFDLATLQASAEAQSASLQLQANSLTQNMLHTEELTQAQIGSLTGEYDITKRMEDATTAARGITKKSGSLLEGGLNSSLLSAQIGGLQNYYTGQGEITSSQLELLQTQFNDWMETNYSSASSEYSAAYDVLMNEINDLIMQYNIEGVADFTDEQGAWIWESLLDLMSYDVPAPHIDQEWTT
jgi:hypothetical protein